MPLRSTVEHAPEDLPFYCTAPVLVLGVGNPLVGDDGFGPAVARRLLSGPLPPGLCVLDAGTGVRTVLFGLVTGTVRPHAVIVVDALDAGREPGELFWSDVHDLPLEKEEDFNVHMTASSNMLKGLEGLGVDVRILACQAGPLPGRISAGLSPAVEGAVGPAARKVLAVASRMLGTAWP